MLITPRDALGRLETMVAMGNLGIPESATRTADCLSYPLLWCRLPASAMEPRKVVSYPKLPAWRGDTVTMQEIFAFQKQGVGPDGRGTRRALHCHGHPSQIFGTAVGGREFDFRWKCFSAPRYRGADYGYF